MMFGKRAPSNDALSLLYKAVGYNKFNKPLDVAFLPNTGNTWPGLARCRSAEKKSSWDLKLEDKVNKRVQQILRI